MANQGGAAIALKISNTFSAGDTITVTIETGSPPTANTGTVSQAVSYPGLPGSSVAIPSGDTQPTLNDSLTTNPADSQAVKSAGTSDELVLTFANSATGPPTDNVTIYLYFGLSVGRYAGGTASGTPVEMSATYNSGGVAMAFNATPTDPGGSPVTDAYIEQYSVTETATGLPTSISKPSPANTSISPFTVTEGSPGILQPGTYLIAPSTGSFAGTATVSASGVQVAPTPSGAASCPTSGGSSTTTAAVAPSGACTFCVTAPSSPSSGPGSLTISGMQIVDPASPGPISVTLTNYRMSFTSAQPAVTAVFNPRVAGQTADDTAAVAAESLYGGQTMNNAGGGAVILASDAEYHDALAASFLGYAPLPYYSLATDQSAAMNTAVPILLNPPTPPSGGETSTAAAAAIKALNATTVYIIGGAFAVSQSVADQLSQIQIGMNPDGSPMHLQVERIAGYTAEETAADIAELATSADITLPATPGAYGRYNDGISESPSGPNSGSVPTAILADDSEFQDALAASPVAYGATVPILLNPPGNNLDPDTATALTKDGVQQVIVVGGKAPVSDAVVAAIEAKGISVLRIAGPSYEDTAAALALFELNDYTPPGNTTQEVDGLDSDSILGQGPSLTIGTSRGDAFQDALSSAQILGGASSYVTPLLLTGGTGTLSAPTSAILSALGTGPAGGLTVYTDTKGGQTSENILGNVVFGGTLAQSPSLVQTELNAIAAG